MSTAEAICRLAEARQLEREGTPTAATQRALATILKPNITRSPCQDQKKIPS